MNYIIEDYLDSFDGICFKHNEYDLPCSKCKAEKLAAKQQVHKQSVQRQQSKIKLMDRSNIQER